jgi:hypothetical protein
MPVPDSGTIQKDVNEGFIRVWGAIDIEQKVHARVGLAAKCEVLVLIPKMLL